MLDQGLLLRLARHVGQAMVAGDLPGLPWDDGLTPAERAAVRESWPDDAAGWDALYVQAPAKLTDTPAIDPLLDSLRYFLRRHRGDDEPASALLSNVVAVACFGSHHLWQDLGAAGRDEVSLVMRTCFPELHRRNAKNLRWKRHLFLCLGEELGRDDLRPPKCDGCDDYEVCYGEPAPLARPDLQIARI